MKKQDNNKNQVLVVDNPEGWINPHKLIKFRIGVDCGVQTGVAVYDLPNKVFQAILTLNFHTALRFIRQFETYAVEVCVEWLNPNAALYGRTATASHKIAANIGAVRRETALFVGELETDGYTVRKVSPVKAKKWTQADLERYTGWTKQTSEHSRDAARIVFY